MSIPSATLFDAIVAVILALVVPSNDTEPVTSPVNVIVLAVVNLLALSTFFELSDVLSTLPSPT